MSGISGAQVFLVDGEAIKVDYREATRVVEQGEWLQQHPAQHLPKIAKVMPCGYVMEELMTVATGDVNLGTVCEALELSVWFHDGSCELDTPATMLKVSLILDKFAPQLLETACDAISYIRPTYQCLTHGDPTAENVMCRADGSYVLIDPLPATESIPDDMAVDVGKLLQSAHGWEEMKGEEPSAWRPSDVRYQFEPHVFEVGQLWCLVHFVRTLPYAREEVRSRVVEKLEGLLDI